MRLRDYQNLLKEVLFKLKQINKTNVPNQTRGLGVVNDAKVSGLIEYNQAIDKLIQVHLFEELTSKIRSYDVFHRGENEVIVQDSSWTSFKSLNEKLIIRIEDLIGVVNNILPKEDCNSLNLKIPENISTISELNDFVSNLDLIFHIYKEFNCEVDFKGVETGSSWITVLIGKALIAKPCIDFLFDIAKKSLELRNLKLDGDRKILEINELRGRLEEQEFQKFINVRKAENEEKYDQLKCKFAEESISLLKTLKDDLSNKNEVIEKTKMAIEKIGELIDKGMEIKLAYNASEEMKVISTQYNEMLEKHKQFVIGLNTQKLIEKRDIEDNDQDNKKNEENIDDEE